MTKRSDDWAESLTAIRRHLHTMPELAFEEHETSAYVAERLESWGIEVSRIAGTGIVGTIRGGSGRKSVGLRADMDGLPIDEQTNVAHASRNEGRMHACGHDGHTTMLLGAAKRLADSRDFDGTVHLLFQPAEEDISGARRMVEEGVFERFPCDAVFGMHNMPGAPEGMLFFKDGPFLAASDSVEVTLTGTGGHGASPHTAIDPVVAGASIVMALQTAVSRSLDPAEVGVVTVGAFNAGGTSSVIPETARLGITVRALSDDARDLLEERVTAIVRQQAASFGVDAAIDYRRGYPATVNSPAETAFAKAVAGELLGEQATRQLERAYGFSEDFAYFLKERPGSYFILGAGDGPPLHSPAYDFNDRILTTGAALWVRLAKRFLAEG